MDDSHAYLVFSDDDLVVSYISHGEEMIRIPFKYGYKFLEASALGVSTRSAIATSLATLFESVSLYDRVPQHIKVESFRHREWLKRTIESLSYTQFYTKGKSLRVTLVETKEVSSSYARHSQTLQSFKI
jgi:hypothetical protein